jgi:hypothetical protein
MNHAFVIVCWLSLVNMMLKRFGVKFHQVTLSCFTKLSVFVYGRASLRGSRWIMTLFCGCTGFTTSPGKWSTRTNYKSRLCGSLLDFFSKHDAEEVWS